MTSTETPETPETTTPAATVTVDGVGVTVPAGASVLRAAQAAGVAVPTLCASDDLEPFGSCRLCLVEIDGVAGTPAACTTPVVAGMRVRTHGPTLDRLRRGVLQLYVSDHPLDCLTCAANGDCRLQEVAAEVGLREQPYPVRVSHQALPMDVSNPYFSFDPSRCVVCSRCVRACEQIQGSFALTIAGRGFDARVTAGAGQSFLDSDCVSCGACVRECPTAALLENTVREAGPPTREVETTCGYCGVGCSLRAQLRGDRVVRMVPSGTGGANAGHACVKGRFAWGYATHPDRVLRPMIRERTDQPWREVAWEEAIAYTARRLRAIRDRYGSGALGGITSSRCTNEEVYLVQKMVRAAFGSNNVDTCARVCHAPTGYGLKQTLGTSAGTQDFASVDHADAVLVIGANPTDAHPVFAARLLRRLRGGATLIVIDPREIDLLRAPHVRHGHHLPLRPGTNVAVINAMAHVVVTEGLLDAGFVASRCEGFEEWARFVADPAQGPEAVAELTGVPAERLREAARAYAAAPNGAIYYGLGVTEHSQGSTMVMGLANLAMACGNFGRPGVGVNPLRGQNNVQGSCDMGSFPHELPGYRHVSDEVVRHQFEVAWGRSLRGEPGLRLPTMLDSALEGSFRALFIQGEDIVQSDPNTTHVTAALAAMELVVVQDLFLGETARYAHVFLPGTTFLEKDGTFTNAERRINRVRPVLPPATGRAEWQVACELATALGYPMGYDHPRQILAEIARLTPTFAGVSFDQLDRVGSVQWPCTDAAPEGTPVMHVDGFVRGRGRFVPTPYVATTERTSRRYPLLLTTGRILTQYNVGAQTRRTANLAWHGEDVLQLHPHDAQVRGVADGDRVRLDSRAGSTTLRARLSDQVSPGVCYTTFHHPVSGTNVVTTGNADWATDCPEYKVTAVQVTAVRDGGVQVSAVRATKQGVDDGR